MVHRREYRRVKSLARRILGGRVFRRVRKVEGLSERAEVLKYLVHSSFKLRLLELEHALEEVDKKEAWVLEVKIKRLDSKVKVFLSTFERKDYLNVRACLADVEEELKKCLV